MDYILFRQCLLTITSSDLMVEVMFLVPCMCLCVWVCESDILQHLNGTGLHCAPPTCIMHHGLRTHEPANLGKETQDVTQLLFFLLSLCMGFSGARRIVAKQPGSQGQGGKRCKEQGAQ